MKAAHVLGILGFATVLGAVAGAAMTIAGSGDGNVSAGEAIVLDRIGDLATSVDGLRDSVREQRNAVLDLEERLVATELEMASRRAEAAAAAAAPPTSMPSSTPAWTDAPGTLPNVAFDGPAGFKADLAEKLRDAMMAQKAASMEAAASMRDRFKKSMELRALPEDERWQRAEDELGLTTVQVDEIRAAKTDFDAAMKEAITEETKTTDGGFSSTFRRIDGQKMRAARTAFDDRVANTLTSEQKDAWNNDGWKGALTGGSSSPIRIHRAGGLRDGGGGTGDTGVGIEIISTGTIEVE